MRECICLVAIFILAILSLVGLFTLSIYDTKFFSIFIDNFTVVLLDLFEVVLVVSIVGLVISLIGNLITEGKNAILREAFEFCIASSIVFGVMRIFLNAMIDMIRL
jgi:hypothetical protein